MNQEYSKSTVKHAVMIQEYSKSAVKHAVMIQEYSKSTVKQSNEPRILEISMSQPK